MGAGATESLCKVSNENGEREVQCSSFLGCRYTACPEWKLNPAPKFRRITRRLRQRGLCSRDSSFRERPRQEWIEIPVPALVSEATFALAQEQFEKNKRFSPRRTIEPSLLQGLLVCQRCGYGLYRASTRTSQRTIYYYRCLGRDGYRHLKGAVCDNQPIRQEQLDAVVWQEIVRLLEDPS
jgi:site-specific DNA recombinase